MEESHFGFNMSMAQNIYKTENGNKGQKVMDNTCGYNDGHDRPPATTVIKMRDSEVRRAYRQYLHAQGAISCQLVVRILKAKRHLDDQTQ